jgi:hypothetical protein
MLAPFRLVETRAEGEGEIIHLQGHGNTGLGALLSAQLLVVTDLPPGWPGVRAGANATASPRLVQALGSPTGPHP